MKVREDCVDTKIRVLSVLEQIQMDVGGHHGNRKPFVIFALCLSERPAVV